MTAKNYANIQLTGQVFGRLTAVSPAPRDPTKKAKNYRWNCHCSCGGTATVSVSNLLRGHALSCGCLMRETSRATLLKHGKAGTPEYSSWEHMIARCYNSKNAWFHIYGGRGIIVCDRWRFGENGRTGFELFLEDVGERPTGRHSIDRWPNKDGNYEPGNVRWATKVQQSNNTSRNVVVEYRGKAMTVAQANRLAGNIVRDVTLHSRLRAGWPLDEALTTPPNARRSSSHA